MFKKIKIIAWAIVRLIQKILVTVSLFLIYIFGFGVTVILSLVFKRKLLGLECNKADTFWINAEGYDADIDNSMRQS